jgi:hypothetical protein
MLASSSAAISTADIAGTVAGFGKKNGCARRKVDLRRIGDGP